MIQLLEFYKNNMLFEYHNPRAGLAGWYWNFEKNMSKMRNEQNSNDKDFFHSKDN